MRAWGIDVGNTHCKIGIIENGKVLDVFRFRTEKEKSVDEYYFQWKNICREIGWNEIPPVWVASVVPGVSIALDRLAQTRNIQIHWIKADCSFSFKVSTDIEGYREIGADLLILAEAASNLVGDNAIVISMGTATALFALKNGVFQGGAIAPGIKGSVESLLKNAALLDLVFLDLPTKAIGQSTNDAMRSGILYGFAGLIDGLVERFKQELALDNLPVIATGGMVGKVESLSRTIQKTYPDLGIQGITSMIMRNSQ